MAERRRQRPPAAGRQAGPDWAVGAVPPVPGPVALGSTNPAKRRALESALASLFGDERPPVTCLEVASGVSAQPWGDEQTRRGAANRARAALAGAPASAAVGIGLEGGVARDGGALWAFSWTVAVSRSGERSAARSAAFALPREVAALLDDGLELGEAMDRLYGVRASKRSLGAVGLLTGGGLDRAELYAQPVLLALATLLTRERSEAP